MASSSELRRFPFRREGQACPLRPSEEGVPNFGASPGRPGAPHAPHFTQPHPVPTHARRFEEHTAPSQRGLRGPCWPPSAQPAAPPRQHVPGEPRPAPGLRSVSFLKMLLGFFWVTCCVRRAPLPRAGDAQFLKCPGRRPPLPPSPALVSPLLHPPLPEASPPLRLAVPLPRCRLDLAQGWC